jgi:uncharacterized Zn finger protein
MMRYDTFTDEVHALILQRGREYFRQGAVQFLSETPEGWTAEVAGQESYHVVITGVDQPVEWFCDCPYDRGPMCKHVAAVFFAIRHRKGHFNEEEE